VKQGKRVLVAITGASGAIYAVHFLRLLQENGVTAEAIVSAAGRQVFRLEMGYEPEELNPCVAAWHAPDDLAASVASGSNAPEAMVVCPCTMGTLAAVANGLSSNLIHRAADVVLKEQRPLILVPRETPLNRTHLLNMVRAQEAGAVIFPAMPAFYYGPQTLDEMARFLAGRICQLLGLAAPGLKQWQGIEERALSLGGGDD